MLKNMDCYLNGRKDDLIMGYDIVSGKSQKSMDEDYNNVLSHIQCQYAYQEHFRNAFGKEITDWHGRLLKKDRNKFIHGIDNFIAILNTDIKVSAWQGNLSNCSKDTLIRDFKVLKELILEGRIGYMEIS